MTVPRPATPVKSTPSPGIRPRALGICRAPLVGLLVTESVVTTTSSCQMLSRGGGLTPLPPSDPEVAAAAQPPLPPPLRRQPRLPLPAAPLRSWVSASCLRSCHPGGGVGGTTRKVDGPSAHTHRPNVLTRPHLAAQRTGRCRFWRGRRAAGKEGRLALLGASAPACQLGWPPLRGVVRVRGAGAAARRWSGRPGLSLPPPPRLRLGTVALSAQGPALAQPSAGRTAAAPQPTRHRCLPCAGRWVRGSRGVRDTRRQGRRSWCVANRTCQFQKLSAHC